MDPLFVVWALSLLATLSFLPIGFIRVLAARRGAADYGRDMLSLGRVILAVGIIAAIVFLGLTVWMMLRS